MITPEQALRIASAAYEAGWHDACLDHLTQREDKTHPLGASKISGPMDLAMRLDPYDILRLRPKKFGIRAPGND